MTTNRRSFLSSAAVNAAALAVMPAAAFAAIPREFATSSYSPSDAWDLSWISKLNTKHRAVFDCAEPESGNGVWRAWAWTRQNIEVLKLAPSEIVPVIVLRHDAIVLAMQQAYWDKYGAGAKKKVTDPMTNKPTNKNPALLDEKDGVVAPYNMAALHKQIAAGAVALACNVAFQECIETVKQKDGVSEGEARKRATSYLVPGVILQPSGVFAAIHAQEAGAMYIRAS
ncbi:MAG: hypothetical protein ABIQ55_01835 [Gemmatimonadaceae bacterium]